ncbi:MAG: hypothetical protein ACOZNI_08425 [Myxococcota bacterium]
MPVGHTRWTVLPHGPLERLAPNLWRVEGVLNALNKRVMTLVRLEDGRIVMHNAIALAEPDMVAIEAWGEVAAILIPNGFHRQDAAILQARYPGAKVYAPRGAVAGAAKATPLAGTYADVPTDGTFSIRELAGIGEREGVLIVRSPDGVTAIFCDTLLNLPKIPGLLGWILHPNGKLAVPRPTSWWFAKDLGALKRDLAGIADEDGLARVVPGHGDVVAESAAEKLREAAGRL